MSARQELKKAKQLVRKAEEQVKKVRKDALWEGFEEVFASHPCLTAVRWVGFTPYFNDGDPCYYSSRHSDFKASFNDEDDWREEWGYSCKDEEHKNTPEGKAGLAVRKVLEEFDSDDMKAVFGDHCQVTVTQEGFKVKEYTHHG